MESYKRSSHTAWGCKYHLVWTTKYRYQVLGGDVGLRCRELIRDIAKAHDLYIHAGSVNRDHVHLTDKYTATYIGFEGGAISQREEFAQAAVGVSSASASILGPAFLG